MSKPSDHGPFRNLEALRDRVYNHAQRVLLDHAAHFACRLGCTDCCQTERTVSDVEFDALARAVAALDDDTRARLAAREGPTPCPLLLDGGCAVYDERPLICRSHGLPLVMEGQHDVCPLNFTELSILTLPDHDLLSVDTLTAILVAVNALYCQEEGGDAHRRRPVSDLFSQAD
jgi:uncharacterized protein